MCAEVDTELEAALERSYALVREQESANYALVFATIQRGRLRRRQREQEDEQQGAGGAGRGIRGSRRSSAAATAAATAAVAAAAATARRAMQRYPTEVVYWPTDASLRLDTGWNTDVSPAFNWSVHGLPREESGDALQWGTAPFERRLAGDGLDEEDPVHYLLAYWLGRHEGFF